MGKFYDLPNSVGAGMTDSKIPDAQAGFEKGLSLALAALGGCNRICEAGGMMGSLMGCSFESLVIDNEALGMVLRAVRGIEVTDETLSLEVIKEHVIDPGHFLGCGQTLEYMESEYLYPTLMDRASAGAWENEGSKDVFERGRETSRAILGSHYPDYLGASVDRAIRERFPIRIESAGMSVSGGRWQA
jgi:trimethylamine--corrinoid protein Co-methyltransferase